LEGLVLEDVGIFYGHLVFLRLFGILCDHFFFVLFGLFFHFLVCCTKKNLATLIASVARKAG
jgi:hypothetical protein